MEAATADGPDGDPAGGPRRHRWWHRGPFVRHEVRLSVGTVLVFLFAFYVVLPVVASHRSQVGELAHINMTYLALGVLLEIAALTAYTQLTHAVLPEHGPKRFRLFRINLSTLALSHVSPGGTAPGAALGYRLLTQSGVSGADTGFALGTQGIGSAVVLNVIFWFSLVAFLVLHGFHVPAGLNGHGSTSASILVVVAAAVGVLLLGAFGGLFYLLTRGQERARRIIWSVSEHIRFLDADRFTSLVERLAERFAVLVDDRPLLWRAGGWAAANWILDAASLWVFVAAFSHFISPVDLLTAYGLANILAAIPITPGGLGVVEFVLVTMLAGFGVADGPALSAVLAYRAVNFWLPIPFGGLAYASLEFEQRSTHLLVHRYLMAVHDRMGRMVATVFGRTVRAGDATTPSASAPPAQPAVPAPPAPSAPSAPSVPAVPSVPPASTPSPLSSSPSPPASERPTPSEATGTRRVRRSNGANAARGPTVPPPVGAAGRRARSLGTGPAG